MLIYLKQNTAIQASSKLESKTIIETLKVIIHTYIYIGRFTATKTNYNYLNVDR